MSSDTNANFTPSLDDYKDYKYKIRPFNLFCAQNFPLIEENFDALTTYQLLCKLNGYLNQIITDLNITEDNMNTQNNNIKMLLNAYNELQSYVNTYFDNLDVQEEINNKLDAMAKDGTLTKLIEDYVNPYIQQQNNKINEIEETVNNRLNQQDSQIGAIKSSSPVIVNSTSEMTDTGKVYILTTNMHIYVYSGGSFKDTGFVYGADVNAVAGYGKNISSADIWANFGNDYNNLLPNKIYTINYADGNQLNEPETNFNGTILSIAPKTNSFIGNVQIAYGLDNTYIRINWSGWTSWKALNIANFSLNSASKWNTYNNNFNNLIPNNTYIISYIDSNIQNAPDENFIGTVITMGGNADVYNGQIQLAFDLNNNFYFRIKWASTWYNWYSFSELDLSYQSIISSPDKWTPFENDCNNLVPNKCYVISYNSNIQNLPETDFIGTIISLAGKPNSYNGQIQIAIDLNNNMLFRVRWSNSWLNWYKIINKDDVNTLIDNKLANLPINNLELYKVFKTVGIIGDSLASGESSYKDNGEIKFVDLYQYSWGQFMAKSSGNKYINFSKGGMTTKGWLINSDYGLPFAKQPENRCDSYIIGLGVNDRNSEMTVGTSADIDLENSDNNKDTFYGNYGKIIQEIQKLYPTVKIFVLTIPSSNSNNTNYNNAIRDMANIFNNVYCIDLYNNVYDAYNSGFIENNKRDGHYNAIAYEYMAEIIARQISLYMADNYEDFKYCEFINTEYTY